MDSLYGLKNKVRVNQLYANFDNSPRSPISSDFSPSFCSPALLKPIAEAIPDQPKSVDVFKFDLKSVEVLVTQQE